MGLFVLIISEEACHRLGTHIYRTGFALQAEVSEDLKTGKVTSRAERRVEETELLSYGSLVRVIGNWEVAPRSRFK